jgi:hypothetical protein
MSRETHSAGGEADQRTKEDQCALGPHGTADRTNRTAVNAGLASTMGMAARPSRILQRNPLHP